MSEKTPDTEKAPTPPKKGPKLDDGPKLAENGSYLPATYQVDGAKRVIIRTDK